MMTRQHFFLDPPPTQTVILVRHKIYDQNESLIGKFFDLKNLVTVRNINIIVKLICISFNSGSKIDIKIKIED